MITLHVESKTPPLSWEEFCTIKPKCSIALDGYVRVGPRFLSVGPYLNCNHHEEVDRLATRSTCAQVLLAIRQGLFSAFKQNSEAHANVYVNDCDEDVCTSWFLLKNHYLVSNSMNPMVNKLVHMEDMLDATAGSYSFPKDLPALQKLAWVFYPYRSFRLNGGLAQKNESDYHQIISDIEHRIMAFVNGNAQEIHLDCRYEIMGGGSGWKLVNELGAQARTGVLSDGISAYASVRQKDKDTYVYTVGKISPFIDFDIANILEKLNKEEFGETTSQDCWGGSSMIGGSPRVSGSKLTPKQVEEIINKSIQK